MRSRQQTAKGAPVSEFFFNYGLFALKAFTVMVLLGALIAFVIAGISKPHPHSRHLLQITKWNDRLKDDKYALEDALLDETAADFAHKQKKSEEKAKRKAEKKALKRGKKRGQAPAEVLAKDQPERKHVFVLDFDGDLQASAVEHLRKEITAVLSVATESDEVVVRLESGGGMVHSYGLAASQLARFKSRKVPLTICVDKVAASGGYMMACVADRLLAAPFSVIGSIGVVAQLPNFNKLLKKHDVDFEMLTAGKHKRTLTILGENTEEGRQKFQDDLEDTHLLFKEFVQEQRPTLDIEKVATGEVWLGTRAKDVGLVDELTTSDDYLTALCDQAEVLEVHVKERKSFQERVMESVELATERTLSRLWHRATTRSLL